MTYAQNLWIYFILLFGIIIVPGMDMFFVIANGLTGGRVRALAATAGVMLGGVFHTVFGGLSVGVLKTLPHAIYGAILLAGAAYMLWIGFTLVRSSITVASIGENTSHSMRAAFSQGFITCALNPKAYMFVLAVYPQFIQSQYGPVWSQALVMGILTVLVQAAIYGSLGLAAARSRDMLIGSPHVIIWTGRVAGALFLIVGVLTIWQAARMLG
jgi:threonine/homoserine/homoserine lactone efflux protein